jgi:hypothetical protein
VAFPKTFEEMKSQGYVFENDATCSGCGEEIEFWATPKGKRMPMNSMPNSTSPAVSHFATCKDADSFRRGK